MKAMHKLAILALAVVAIGAGFQGADPAETLKQISDFRNQKMNELRTSGQPLTAASVNAIGNEARDKAKAAVKGIDPAKIDPKQGFAWAQLFSMAEMHKEACDAATRYLETKPDAGQKYAAQSLMMRSCNALNEGHMLAMTLDAIVPPDAMAGLSLASVTAGVYAETIQKTMGLDAALKALTRVESLFPTADDFANDKDEKVKETKLGTYYNVYSSVHQTRAEMLIEAGKTADAVAALEAGLAKVPEKYARTLKAGKIRLTMKGNVAPALTIEKSYGEFKGLESLKGKVVMLDFFAHWCGPCIASFPDMKKLYEDLKPKGFEIVQITTYYGYYKRENTAKRDMPRDVEYGKMGEFIAEHQLPWPVAYGERTNFEAYGITGIPHVTLLDRKGVVREIKIGYSPESFAKFRKEVEALIEEK